MNCGYSEKTKKCSRKAYPNKSEKCTLNDNNRCVVIKEKDKSRPKKTIKISPKKPKKIIPKKTKKKSTSPILPYQSTPYYPDTTDPYFARKIYQKKEFYQHRIPEKQPEHQHFQLSPSQSFLRNFINPLTPYKSLLVYHGTGVGKTCTAVSIAEQFIPYLPTGQKVYILLPPTIVSQFQKTIFNPETLLTYRDSGYLEQCTGNHYLKEFDERQLREIIQTGKISETIRKKSVSMIRKSYVLMGYEKFASYVTKIENKAVQSVRDTSSHERLKLLARKRILSNSVLLIDEAHRIRMDEKSQKLCSPVIERAIRDADNLRLVLLSATPMYNSGREIVFLLNLLRINNGEPPLRENMIFKSNGEFQPDGLETIRSATRGYVSYLRGENPQTFPMRLYPDVNRDPHIKKFSDFPTKDLKGETIASSERFRQLLLLHHPMSDYHQQVYLESMEGVEIDSSMDSSDETQKPIFFTCRQSSLCCFPTTEEHPPVSLKYGRKGFSQVFRETTTRGLTSYSYRHSQGFFRQSTLERYSAKLAAIISYIKKSEGIVYVYSEYITTGILLLALALEENGIPKWGSHQLLDSPTKAKPANNGSYIFVSGRSDLNPNLEDDLQQIKDTGNHDGSRIKVILASPLGGEGLDLHNIREIHLLEPWFHMNKVEQVIGRGIRNYSHYSLAPEKRNTTIYLHASVLTGSEKDRESVDLSIYRLAEKKMFQMATLEGVLKTNAIDCQLNKNGNFFAPQKIKIKTSQSTTTTVTRGDKPYSKGCLYQKNCQYQCEGFSDYTFNPSTSLDKNTYNIQFAKGEIEQVTRKIKEFFGQYFTATLERLQAYIDDTISPTDPEIIYYSLQYLLDSREQWIDMYQRKGYLVYRSDNYLFQPVEFQEEGIPHQTRIKPIPWKNTHIEIPLTFFNSTDQDREAKPVAPPA